MAGMISIPLYPTISSREYAYILKETEVMAVFMGPGDLYQKISAIREEVPTLKHLIGFENQDDLPNWSALFKAPSAALQTVREKVRPEDLFTIIYT